MLTWLVMWLAVQSPYAGQEQREIKALSSVEVAGYLAGDGMGFAMAAELNGHPGPRHVLDLAEQLALTPEQVEEVDAVFGRMNAAARARGAELVEAERRLDRAFAAGDLDAATLERLVEATADLRGRLRSAHLAAHLETRALLTPSQRARYAELRGYTGRAAHGGGHASPGHHAAPSSPARLFRVILPVDDVERAVAFYRRLLDQEGERVTAGRHYFDCGGVIVAVVDPRADGDDWDPRSNQDHVYFAVDDLAAVHARATELGGLSAEMGEIAERPWGEVSFYMADPAGNPLAFVEAGTEFRGRSR